MTLQELKAQVYELKAQAYDALFQIERWQLVLREINIKIANFKEEPTSGETEKKEVKK